jgi:hypothetical protein
MASLLASSVAVLSGGLKSAAGESTTYRRGNDSIDGAVGVPVRVRHEEYVADDDVNLTARERDWIYWAEDLAKDGQRWEPQRGDEIDWIDPLGVKRTYQVLPRAGDRCYRHTDTTMQQLRVYTVETLTNPE